MSQFLLYLPWPNDLTLYVPLSLPFFSGGITVSIIAFVFTIKFLCELAARVVSFLQNEDPGRRGDRSIYDYVRGNYLDPRSCKVSWDWKEPQEVGQTMSFRVQVSLALLNAHCYHVQSDHLLWGKYGFL